MSWRRAERVRTAFQELEAWTTPRAAEIRVSGSVHAWWHERRLLTGLAWDAIAAGIVLRPAGPPRSVLMLGVAGGTALRVVRHLVPEAALHGVEIDPGILDLARRHLRLDALGATIEVGDARAWLEANTRRFDAVVDDCYLGGDDDVEAPAWDDRRVALLSRALAPDGVLVANLVDAPGHERQVAAARAALGRAFPSVTSVIPPQSWNEILVAGDERLSPGALASFVPRFPDAKDRRKWRMLALRGG